MTVENSQNTPSKSTEDIQQIISRAKTYCEEQGLLLEFSHEISEEDLQQISQRSQQLPSMYFADVNRYKARLKNGCFLLKRGKEIVGHIFAHKHNFRGFAVFERSSLWVHPDYRKYNLGLLLMFALTEKFQDQYVISIAKEPKVHYNNEFLGMKRMLLSEISSLLVVELEKIGKLRDELHYKYYVNNHLETTLRRFQTANK